MLLDLIQWWYQAIGSHRAKSYTESSLIPLIEHWALLLPLELKVQGLVQLGGLSGWIGIIGLYSFYFQKSHIVDDLSVKVLLCDAENSRKCFTVQSHGSPASVLRH